MSVSFRIDELPKTTNQLLHAPWRRVHTHTTRWHWLVRQALGHRIACIRADPKFPYDFAEVSFVWHSSVEPDFINMANSFKPVLDGLVRHGVLVDDSPSHLRDIYSWEKAPRKKGYIEVEIEAVKRPEVAA